MPPSIHPSRLNASIHGTASAFGPIPDSTGMRRLALSAEDKGVRDWLVTACEELGCEITVDQMGNIFAKRPGTAPSSANVKPIAIGSHLDTQPAGGRYDGILGVLSGLEVLRTLNDHKINTYLPITLVNWTNEEGARFPGAMMSSGVWSQQSSTNLEAAWAVKDTEGMTVKQALIDTGYLGPVPCSYKENELDAHFELHIEQGPLLERASAKIGVVTSVQSMTWYEIRVHGIEGHSGTAPMPTRSDALVTACLLIAAVRDAARDTTLGVATVGVIKSATQSQATIPSDVTFIIDIRASTDALVAQLSTDVFRRFDTIIAHEANSTRYETIRTWSLPESLFDPTLISCVRESALAHCEPSEILDMKSGAGHDSAWTSKVIPTTMIFVPSKDGVSHHPDEYTSPEHCALGAQVLLESVLRYDELVRMSMEDPEPEHEA
ncbi:hypothetical protein G7K_6708-t1 [Saitoella complicata NRRL Y-17804]|uniref:Peptidase M20 dimerisation domain-containing protein n=1 Tax=Saitoella complicata (strain BCRC 22490 / CBS 7301 / JCM 7358 / NBRC 10748 / NRRL Y-17804) TaxID=698492 RepID=A0A0E9NSJ1_SAICN|nr:hypothetical protein G7K_6708-t1 [Saitoella complicata NRRL Y-17804]